VPERRKFRTKKDLERYYMEVEGHKSLETFLVPDIDVIRQYLKKK
jgi:hypothetical protein